MTHYTNVNVGDKIVATNTKYTSSVLNGTVLTVSSDEGDGYVTAIVDDSGDPFAWFMQPHTYEPYVKETPMTQMTQEPKLWKDMTPEEKGALLLAHHEGKTIEYFDPSHQDWVKSEFLKLDNLAYRVKPAEPVVETGVLYWSSASKRCLDFRISTNTHKITLTIRDGVVDPIAQVEEL